MNVFVLDRRPDLAPIYLADVHVIKMCLETAQILSSISVRCGKKLTASMPKPYNPKHPVICGIRESDQINWLLEYNKALHEEYKYRFGKPHVYSKLVRQYFKLLQTPLDTEGFLTVSCEGFTKDFKDFETDVEDIVDAYRAYYCFKKSQIKRWKYTRRKEPSWVK